MLPDMYNGTNPVEMVPAHISSATPEALVGKSKAALSFQTWLALLTLFAGSATADAAGSFQIMVFSKTAAFRHASIADGIAAIRDLGALNNFDVVATEDSSLFTDQSLAAFKAVVFLSTTGDILDANQQAAFERYIQN